MTHFIKCSLESFLYRRDNTVTNNPVNLSLCKSIKKGKFAWYPDNEGRPSIVFEGCDIEWSYGSEKERDKQFDDISLNRLQC